MAEIKRAAFPFHPAHRDIAPTGYFWEGPNAKKDEEPEKPKRSSAKKAK